MFNNFQFTIPQNIVFGEDVLKKLPEILNGNQLNNILVVSDRGIEKTGLIDKVRNILDNAQIKYKIYLDVKTNPTVEMVNEALNVYKKANAQGVIAIGGGSPMDVAKSVAVLAKYGGSIIDYEGANKIPGYIIPVVAIPTTAGTGSEVTAFAVIVDNKRHYKLTVFDYKLIPKYALIDSKILMTIPPSVAAACGIDAMVHAIEAYLSRNANPFSDAMAEKALELIGSNLRNYYACRENENSAFAMAVASNFAGIAFAWARLGNVHAMSHPVSAYFNVPHGVSNAILLPYVLEYNKVADRDDRYEKIFKYIAENKNYKRFRKQMLIKEIVKINTELGIPAHLSDVGVTGDKIVAMATDAMKSGNIQSNPRMSSLEDIIHIYNQAL